MLDRHSCFALVVCLFASAIGCQSLMTPVDSGAAALDTAVLGKQKSKVSTRIGPYPEQTEQEALAEVLPQLQELAIADPTAHAKLMEQLSTTKPSLWAMTVDRALSTRDYQLQLAGVEAQPTAEFANKSEKDKVSETAQLSSRAQLSSTAQASSVAKSMASVLPPPPLPQEAQQTKSETTNEIRLVSAEISEPVAAQPIDNQQPILQQRSMSPSAQLNESQIRLVAATSKLQNPLSNQSLPLTDRAPGDWQTSLDATIAMLENEVRHAPQNSDETYQHARLRLLQLAAGRQSPAVESIPGLPTSEQSYWSQQMFALSTLLDSPNMPERSRRAAAAIHYQGEASAQLSQLASLRLRNASFCKEIYGYGAYEPIDSPSFRPGDRVQLYLEVENYRSNPTERGLHTSLATSYRFLDKSGQVVDSGDFPLVEDYCLAIRRDFHIQYRVLLPKAIYPGEYELEVTVNDQLGDKIATDTVPFAIGATSAE